MIRRLGKSVALLCLLLAIVAVFTWVRIGGYDEHYALALRGRVVFVSISRDWGISVDWLSGYSRAELGTAFSSPQRPVLIARPRGEKDLGLVIVRHGMGRYMQNASAGSAVALHGVRAHWHSLLICLCIAPILWLYHFIQARLVMERRKKRGLCLGCGYDLRATTGRCPECGASRGEPHSGELTCPPSSRPGAR